MNRLFTRSSLRIWAFAALFAPLLVACSDDDDDAEAPDTTLPKISLTQPALEATAETGSQLRVAGTITDDRGLSQVRLEIHSNADGHSHGKTAEGDHWEMDTIIDAAGATEFTLNLQMEVPAEALTGPYHLILNALDQQGNEAEFVEVNLMLTGAEAPVFSNLKIDGLDTSGDEPTLDFGATESSATLTLTGTVAASGTNGSTTDRLERLVVELYEHHGHEDHDHGDDGHDHDDDGHDHGEEKAIYTWESPDEIPAVNGAITYNLNLPMMLMKADLEDGGEYELIIMMEDQEENISYEEAEFVVSF